MNKDKLAFLICLFLFALVNIYLLVSDKLVGDATGIGIIIAAGITLALYSFLYKDNPLFKFAENLYVGVAAAYTLAQVWYPIILVDVLNPLFDLNNQTGGSYDGLLIIPALLDLVFSRNLPPTKSIGSAVSHLLLSWAWGGTRYSTHHCG